MANWFVDFSAANDGDGTAFNQASGGGASGAYNTLASKTFASGDLVWIRRKSITITSLLTLNQGGTTYIGWPESGDTYFLTRPSAAQASWDADATGYAEINTTTSLAVMVSINASTNTTVAQEFHRMKFFHNNTTVAALDCVAVSSLANFYACYWDHKGGATGGVANRVIHMAAACSFTNCTATYTGVGTANAITVLSWSATTFPTTFTGCTLTTSGPAFVISNPGVGYFINCTISNAANSTRSLVIIAGAGFLYLYNCTLTFASTSVSVIDATGTTGKIIGIKLTISGRRISLPNGSMLHISSFTQTASSSDYAIVPNTGSVIAGENFSFVSGNTTGDLGPGIGSAYYLKNCTFTHASPVGAANGNFLGAWILDHGGTVGAFRYIGPRGEVTTEAVKRERGERTTLKFNMNSGTGGTDPFWRQLPFIIPGMESILVHLPAYQSTITIYGAHKGYSSDPPLADDLWFDTDYISSTTGTTRTYASSKTTGSMTSDDSVWTGDTSLTQFKLSVTVTPGQACLCPIRLFFIKRVASAYLYIDPRPVVS